MFSLRRSRISGSERPRNEILPFSTIISSDSPPFDDVYTKNHKKNFIRWTKIVTNRIYVNLYPNIIQLIQSCKSTNALLTVGLLCFLFVFKDHPINSRTKEKFVSFESILLPKSVVKSNFYKPSHTKKLKLPDFGGLEEVTVLNDNESRQIEIGSDDNDNDDDDKSSYLFDYAYFQFDDDMVHEEAVNSKNKHCRYNDWHRYHFPTCNSIHETRTLDNDERNRYISAGGYRQVFEIHDMASASPYVLKTLRLDKRYYIDNWELIHMDALVMERLTQSPRIVDIYGHCAFAVSTEHLRFEFEDQLQWKYGYIQMDELTDDVQNNVKDEDKLIYALEMAEAIADLHGFKDGVIIHDDIQPIQFLLTKDFHLKLNDFNRAEIMLYDEIDGEYCRYKNGPGNGNQRAPEEYKDEPLNEKIDVWSFGTNVYTLLTGLWVYFHLELKYGEVAKLVMSGEKPYIDNRYRKRGNFIEKALVHVLDRCFEYNADDRADIFELVSFLRDTVHEYENQNRTSFQLKDAI